ncbi:nitroreductase/quinone reductase family protein [Nakamurella sp. GG22]
MDSPVHLSFHWLYPVKRWMYRGGHPNWLARQMNRLGALQYSKGLLSPTEAVTLHVRGRTSGKTITFPLVLVDHDGEHYLVSMLGPDANWVRNVHAAGGRAVLERGTPRDVRLDDVPVDLRGPILRDYLAVAPGARAHLPIDRQAPLSDFDRIADQFPVFLVRDL